MVEIRGFFKIRCTRCTQICIIQFLMELQHFLRGAPQIR